MGLEIHCFAWDKDAVCKEEVDSFYPISIVEKEKIFQICQSIEIDGICTIASDVAAPTVSYVAEKMHLNANSYQSAVNANNKYIMRDLLSQAEIRCPKYKMIQSLQDASSEEWEYPLIVKPTDRSGSLGVAKVMSYEELCPAVEFALSVSFEKQVMIEEFIEGREISVEFISYKGVHYPLQITDKVTTGAPHFLLSLSTAQTVLKPKHGPSISTKFPGLFRRTLLYFYFNGISAVMQYNRRQKAF